MTDKEKQELKVKILFEGKNSADEEFRRAQKDVVYYEKQLQDATEGLEACLARTSKIEDDRKVAHELWDEERMKLEQM